MSDITTERVTRNVSLSLDPDLHSELARVDPAFREIAAGLQRWVDDTRNSLGGSLFRREKYAVNDRIYDQMRVGRSALYDDELVSGVAELSEGMALQGVQWESSDWDTQDLFNQMAAEQNLDGLLRKMWREDFTVNQCTLAYWWDWGEFTVRGATDKGNKRKTTKKVWFPRLVSILDPTRIAPVGLLAFGQERLTWRATGQEMAAFESYLNGQYEDDLMDRFYVDRYQLSDLEEQRDLIGLGIDTQRLILLSEENTSRYTATRADFERFPPVRLKSIFRLLDLKQQLMEADRVSLVGAANYILLVKKGDKENPAHPEEIANLKANYHTLAKVPVIFSDHRLAVEIVTPKQDFTLQRDKYDVIDGRIAGRLLSGVANTKGLQSNRGEIHLGRPAGLAMEGRRRMMGRHLERFIARRVVEHPNNKGLFLEGAPSLTFSPPKIHIEDEATTTQAILALRTQKELSRESVLEYFGFDQQVEAMRRTLEEKTYDDVFQTVVPFSSPAAGGQPGTPPAAQGGAGNQGGRPAGGGKPSQNPTKVARTPQGTTPSKPGS